MTIDKNQMSFSRSAYVKNYSSRVISSIVRKNWSSGAYIDVIGLLLCGASFRIELSWF